MMQVAAAVSVQVSARQLAGTRVHGIRMNSPHLPISRRRQQAAFRERGSRLKAAAICRTPEGPVFSNEDMRHVQCKQEIRPCNIQRDS
jgi:hypothetical protein